MKKWTEKEINFLKINYSNLEKELLLINIKKSWNAIKLMAEKLGLKRNHDFKRNSNFNKLLDKSNESLYWLGFLLADGHFNFNNKRIKLTLSTKDINHLVKYSKFIETTNLIVNKSIYPSVSVTTKNIEKFHLVKNLLKLENSNKTIYPNDFNDLNFNKEQMLSLIIGFIDGDGNIQKQTGRKDSLLQIHVHKNWFDNILFIENFIYNYFNESHDKIFTRIGNDSYTKLIISNYKLLRKLKTEVLKLDLPILKRKWDNIDENAITSKEIIKLQRQEIKELYSKGCSPVDILKTNKYTISLIYNTIRKIKELMF